MLGVSLDKIISHATLTTAWQKVKANGGCGGVDGISLRAFEQGLHANLATLSNEVKYDTYRPHALLRVEIDKPSGESKRPLSIPTIKDRVLQTAVTLVLTPLFEAEFEDVSFAYRKGNSVNQAIAKIERLREQGFIWVVDADIHHYFDEVSHKLLMIEVEKLVKDEGILRLIHLWLKATVVDGNNRYKLHKGIPQGSPLSPLLANLYLDHLDEALLNQQFHVVRYADDFVVLCKSPARANEAVRLTKKILKELKLKLNNKRTKIVDFNQGFRFLGVQFVRSLAFKSKENLTVKALLTPEKTEQNNAPSQPEPANKILNEMTQSFIDAKLSPDQFPSETTAIENFEPPDAEIAIASGNEPHLKTLYLMEHGTTLGKEYERFTIKKKGEIIQEIPAIHIDQIMVFGNAQITTQVMHFCLQKRIPIYLLSGKGHFYGVVDSYNTDPVLLHKAQFTTADDHDFCLTIAKQIIKGKISNSRLILQRHSRNKKRPKFEKAITLLARVQKQLINAQTLDQARGHEGSAARIYFQAIASELEAKWKFTKRIKQPPTDPINAMLSYGYTLLFHNIYSFLRARGLNPHIGYLHPIRMGHPALASDMMEEYRAIVVDAVVLNLVFNQKINSDDFILPTQAGEPCLLTPSARRLFVREIEKKLNAAIKHPISLHQLDYRRCMAYQINHLAAVIRKTESGYQPLILR